MQSTYLSQRHRAVELIRLQCIKYDADLPLPLIAVRCYRLHSAGFHHAYFPLQPGKLLPVHLLHCSRFAQHRKKQTERLTATSADMKPTVALLTPLYLSAACLPAGAQGAVGHATPAHALVLHGTLHT